MRINGQAVNPYLPSWEYVPDGEPYVFGDRVYVYGSHDRFQGYAYCLNDYVCWSAPVKDLSEWKYEGVIYHRTDDPANSDGEMCLYAPDVAVGTDGRYYLYYVLDRLSVVSVAVSDSPAGQYKFYGYCRRQDGTLLGKGEQDLPNFDPGVLREGKKTYLYTGFCKPDDPSRKGSVVTVLGEDMLTVEEEPRLLIPTGLYGTGTGFEGHEFFEASSIRKIRDEYYFIYSSVQKHELCYATSKNPTEGFQYRGVLVSNNDSHIGTYKEPDFPAFYGGNNHGSLVEIEGQWYIFYHRHTNGTNFSRQGCMEPVQILEDGRIPQAEMTTSGSGRRALSGRGEFPAYLACNLFCAEQAAFTAPPGDWMDCRFPKITQEGKDGDENPGFIENMRDGATAGFKYFDCRGVSRIGVRMRGYCNGVMEVLTEIGGEVLGSIPVGPSNEWKEYEADISIPDGEHALYFRYRGKRNGSMAAFWLKEDKNHEN